MTVSRLEGGSLCGVPTVLRSGPYRFHFFAADAEEPSHVHVQRDLMFAKVWLAPPEVAWDERFSMRELGRILRIVMENQELLLRRWNEFFSSGRTADRFRPDHPRD